MDDNDYHVDLVALDVIDDVHANDDDYHVDHVDVDDGVVDVVDNVEVMMM